MVAHEWWLSENLEIIMSERVLMRLSLIVICLTFINGEIPDKLDLILQTFGSLFTRFNLDIWFIERSVDGRAGE